MNLYSTNNKENIVPFDKAVLKGIADDGGLFMPATIPKLSDHFFKQIGSLTFNDIAIKVAEHLLSDSLPKNIISEIVTRSLNFDAPLHKLNDNVSILELFHGPTLAFKDFGARFMAQTMSYFNRNNNEEITILVATSGDTGSAVANGFYKVEGIRVILLYPGEKVSHIQEQQLTTLGENVSALEVEGTFDDCQRFVKKAFLDKEITSRLNLSSANSINIARLIPQSFYYFYAYAQLNDKTKPVYISVPSGNFGNLTAGLFAKEMGLPVSMFIAATNSNDVFPKYLESGRFEAKPSVKTISNAMDVGNPSNLARIQALYNNDLQTIKNIIWSSSFTDEMTKIAIKNIHDNFNYTIDPHGAVGYLALNKFIESKITQPYNGIVLETAHPAKFADVVNSVISTNIEIPEQLQSCLDKDKISVKINNDFEVFKEYLLS